MSENANVAEERKPYTVRVEEKMPFEPDADTKILTSNQLCKLCNEYFRAAFADYEACAFEMSKNGPATLTLVFNHGKHVEGQHYAVDMVNATTAGNDVIQRSRAFDRLAKEGDRYHVTEDGKDVLKKFLSPRYVDRNGKVNWGVITSEYVEQVNFYGPGTPLTKIEGIDPRQLCFAIFGSKDGDSTVDYQVDVKGTVSSTNSYGFVNPNYVLHILRAHNDQISKTYEDLGFGAVGSRFIR